MAILGDAVLQRTVPSLVLPSVRSRACDCVAAVPPEASSDWGATMSRCIAAAVAQEPIPSLPSASVRAMASALAPPAANRSYTGAVVDIRACRLPEYPASAMRAGATGVTRMQFQAGADGRVQDGEVVKSSGTSPQHKLLDAVALVAMLQCPVKAAIHDGEAVEASFQFEWVWKIQ